MTEKEFYLSTAQSVMQVIIAHHTYNNLGCPRINNMSDIAAYAAKALTQAVKRDWEREHKTALFD